MKRFPLEQYASLELNQVAFPKTGMVVSQVPLGADFTEAAPCENGMWVVADKAAGVITPPSAQANAENLPIGIVYTAEKEYDMNHYGLKTFGRKIAGDYPRVGLLGIGDTVTTNCLQYDETVFVDAVGAKEHSALFAALEDLKAHPLYVVPVAGSPVPDIVKAAPATGIYAKIVKFYTVPNGEKGVKYQVIRV